MIGMSVILVTTLIISVIFIEYKCVSLQCILRVQNKIGGPNVCFN